MKTVLVLLTLAIPASASLTSTYYAYGGEQTFNVLTTGDYSIVAYAASGGAGQDTSGGNGAEIGGMFYLTAGEVLDLYVGTEGGSGVGGPAGGGGGAGAFVILAGNPLVVAGGGGGGSLAGSNGLPGLTTQAGSGGNGGSHSGSGGTGGQGGNAANDVFGGGGGGGYISGGGTNGPSSGEGGSGYPGVTFAYGYNGYGYGGAGDGGGGDAQGGGGGGGYSGGGGGSATYDSSKGAGGGGGGSYLDASVLDGTSILIAGENNGDGFVEIDLVTPEPASFGLLGLGLMLFLAAARLRRTT